MKTKVRPVLWILCAGAILAFSAITTRGGEPIVINTFNREEVVEAFRSIYLPATYIESGWDGNLTNCVAGTVSKEYQDATLSRVNYFRAMAGLRGDIVFDEVKNTKCQQAALMMLVQGDLSHTPGPEWACYTKEGAEAAGNSNLSLGSAGHEAIDRYIDDRGTNNFSVGHRRWIFYPFTKIMGSGSIPNEYGNYKGANALWIFDDFYGTSTEPVRTPWPPRGYVPYSLLPTSGRWSFTYMGADCSKASVSMWWDGKSVDSVVETRVVNDNTVVWQPQELPFLGLGKADTVLTVTVSNIVFKGAAQTLTYDVTVINPYSAISLPVSVLDIPLIASGQLLGKIPMTRSEKEAVMWHKAAIFKRVTSGPLLTLQEQQAIEDAIYRGAYVYQFTHEEEKVILAALREARMRLMIEKRSDRLVLSWADDWGILDEADDPSGPWKMVQGRPPSPYTLPFSARKKFYRLRF